MWLVSWRYVSYGGKNKKYETTNVVVHFKEKYPELLTAVCKNDKRIGVSCSG